MSTFEIRDEEIDVDKTMERIRENIKKRRHRKGYYEAQRLLQEPGFKPQVSGLASDKFMQLEYLQRPLGRKKSLTLAVCERLSKASHILR